MKKISGFTFLLFIIFSCKKSNETNGLLTKFTRIDSVTSLTMDFTYGSDKKLSGYKATNKQGSSVNTQEISISRDGTGRIIQINSMFDSQPGTVRTINYSGNSTLLISAVGSFGADKDSVHYDYSGNKITATMFFKAYPFPYRFANKLEYFIQDGNIVRIKNYDTTGVLEGETILTYDTKKVAITQTVEEMLITDLFDFGSNNNITSSRTIWYITPLFDQTVTISHNYSDSGKPISGQRIDPLCCVNQLKYYYN